MSETGKSTKELSPLKRAFLKIEEMEAKLAASENAKREPIAIVGLGCRLPNGIHDPETFWQLLRDGVDAVKEFPRNRWDVDAYYDPDPNKPGKMITKWGAFLDEVDKFDPHFFGISPREAASMDPQQRLLLEVAWEALETAGQAPDKLLNTRTGVFLAMCKVDYAQLILKQNDPTLLDTYYASGNAYSTAAGRISYVLGLQGPCLTVDTACSSSLVAVHLACQSLRNGESRMAIAGGVNLVLSPDNTITFSKSNMLAADGRCKTFDASADGFVQGEGCGMIVLKRLSDARADGDRILALIRGSAVNQDGASSGLTAPNGPSQEAVILDALANAGVQPEEVSYIETHGTGTALGDPIEVQAIGAALGKNRAKENPVLLGAVKTNLGHLEGAAGITGLIKVVLALQHKQIPATLHFKTPNPLIPWHELPVEVVTQLRAWPKCQGQRIAGVSSFGFSGTNAHVILQGANEEQGAEEEKKEKEPSVRLRRGLTLSAKSEAALNELTQHYERHLADHEEDSLAEVCSSANAGRAQLSHRLAIAAETKDELREKLAAFAQGQIATHVQRGFVVNEDQPQIAFLFTGQGAQYVGMGRRLYETQPVFRRVLEECNELLRSHLEKPLLSVLYPDHSPLEGGQGGVARDAKNLNDGDTPNDTPLTPLKGGIADSNQQPATSNEQPTTSNLLDQTAYTQPALFAIEYALAQLWQSWGIKPAIVMGHSVGEYVAACIAGVFSLEDGLKLIAARGRLMQALPANGAMAAIFASEQKVAAAIAAHREAVAIAAINGPENIVVSGERNALQEICARLAAAGIKHKPLAVSHAFHSPLMEPMLEEFERVASAIEHSTPRIGFVSNLTGKLFDFRFKHNDPQSTIHDPQSYWRSHVREAVQFQASVQTLHDKGYRVFLEIGPQPTLLGMIGESKEPKSQGAKEPRSQEIDSECVWIPSLRKGKEDWAQMLDSLGLLYVNGVNPDWQGFDRDSAHRKVALPTYPFQRRRFWFDDERRAKVVDGGLLAVDRNSSSRSSRSTIPDPQSTSSHPLLGSRLHTPLLREIIFETQLSLATVPFIADHQVHGVAVLPTTAYLEMINAAAIQAFGEGVHTIEDMDIREALLLHEEEARSVQLMFSPENEERCSFQVISFVSAEQNGAATFKTHASGKLRLAQPNGHLTQASPQLEELRALCREEISVETFYNHLLEGGLQFGPRFLGVTALWHDGLNALGRIRMTDAIAPEAHRYRIHPALLDACLQVVGAIMSDDKSKVAAEDIFMPIGLHTFRLLSQPGEELWSHGAIRRQGDEETKSQEARTIDFHIYDVHGQLIAEVLGLQVKRASPEMLQRSSAAKFQDWFYEVKWEPKLLEREPEKFAAADYLPANSALGATLLPELQSLSAEHGFHVYDEILPHLDALSLAYVLQSFEQLGWKFSAGQRFTTAQMAEQLHVSERHHRLLQRLLEMLREEGFLQHDGEAWEVCELPQYESAQSLAQSFEAEFAAYTAEYHLLQRGGQNLAAVLQGNYDPLQVLFPGGSFANAEKLYDESIGAKVYNGLVRKVVQTIAARLPKDRKLHVLEVGAGTGGTTSFILQDFPVDRTKYVFTDLSPLFLSRAREKFKQYPFVHYELLDIEQNPETQGFAPHQYDLIVCANVVHATKDLHETLANIKTLLAPEGLLMLCEGMRPQRWIDLTFGMTEGWWRFTDVEVRATYPLITQAQWQTLLESEGFTQFTAVPQDLSLGRALSQNAVLLARGPRFLYEGRREKGSTGVNSNGEEALRTPPVIVVSSAASQEEGAWLLLRDRNGLAEVLAEQLHARGEQCVLVSPAESFAQLEASQYSVDPTSPADFKRLLHDAFVVPQIPCRGVIDLWPSDDAPVAESSFEHLLEAQSRGARSVLSLAQALLSTEGFHARGLWIATRGAQSVGDQPNDVAVAQSPIWGMGRALTLEHPELHCVRVDLGPYDDIGNAQFLLNEIRAKDSEDQIAYRGGVRYIARLARMKIEDDRAQSEEREAKREERVAKSEEPEPVQLEIVVHSTLDGLALRPATRRVPDKDEIEIRVAATGLNFRDVLNVLGMRGDSDPLGGEVSGVVVRVGENIIDYKIGDEVIAVTVGGFSTYVTTGIALVVPKPKPISFAEAATIPLAFLTAHYALHVAGKITVGERVLIHAAAGGVGMAAVQLAQRAGAEVFATAGSAEKREYLKALGIEHVMNSRTLNFAEEVMALTNGEGLDVVLNSLTGDFISKSLGLLRANGRFLEIGKKEIWNAAQVAQANGKATYFAIDLAERIKSDPLAIRPLFLSLMQAIASGELEPLPHKAFSLEEAGGAFRFMAQAKHIGKVVVAQEAVSSDQFAVTSDQQPRTSNQHLASSIKLHENAAYLITGGLSGLGLLVAQWLVEQGARHLVLMGRRAPSAEAKRAISALEQRGAQVFALQGDVSQAEDVTRILAEINQALPLLRGIIHSAGVLDDGVLLQQTWERYTNVLAPKVYGAWHLHAMTKHMPLDFFVLFSSVSALLGSPGQTNHAAANAFLDALAHHRRALGLPAMSINWGAWSEIGAAARHNLDSRIAVRGIDTFTPEQGLQVLAMLFEHPVTQAGVMPVNWATFGGMFAGKRMPPYFSALTNATKPRVKPAIAAAKPQPEILQQLRQASATKRQKLLLHYVEAQALKVLSMETSQTIHEKQPLTEIGLDSLMAVELRNLLGTGLGLPRALPATLAFDYPTTAAMASYLAKELFEEEATAPAVEVKQERVDAAGMLDKLEELSEEEIERLFAEKMGAN